jgi:hypothetical protein
MWGRAADRIDDLIAYHKVDVCTIRTKRVVTGQNQDLNRLATSIPSRKLSLILAGWTEI